MNTHSFFRPLILAQVFEQFLQDSSYARRTRESYKATPCTGLIS